MKRPSFAALAACAFALSAGSFAWTVFAAMRVDDRAAPLPLELPQPRALASKDGLTDRQLGAAVDRDPFHPARVRPQVRYGSPATPEPPEAPEAPPPLAAASLVLVGTTAFGGGKGIALVQAPGAAIRTLRPGDSIAGFVLRRVERGRAELRGKDSTLVLKFSNQDR